MEKAASVILFKRDAEGSSFLDSFYTKMSDSSRLQVSASKRTLDDDLQSRIVREITTSTMRYDWNVAYSYSSLAKRLGVGKETVRTSLIRAREVGYFEGWQLMINPSLIGRKTAGLVIDFHGEGNDHEKTSAISQLKLIEGVTQIFDYANAGLRIVLYYETDGELERKTQLISSICGNSKPAFWPVPTPVCRMRMRKTDWEIIRELRKNPRARISDVAGHLRVSTRTVNRRVSMMSEERAFSLLPKTNMKKYPTTGFVFLIRYSDEEKKVTGDKFLSSNLERIVYFDTLSREYSTFAISRSNFAEAEEVMQLMKKVDGIGEVRMDILKEIIHVSAWLDEEIGKKLASAK